MAAAAETDATPASGGGSRESAGWHVDGAADGGAPDEEASGGADGGELEQERSEAEVASGATSDVAAAAETDATPASNGGSRESAGWHVDGAADGGATDGAASGGADGGELEQEPSGAEAASSATGNFVHPL